MGGSAWAELILGGFSMITTAVEQTTRFEEPSVTLTQTEFVPGGMFAEKTTFVVVGPGLFAAILFVCEVAPLRVQTTVKASPSASFTRAATVAVPHSTVPPPEQETVGGWFVARAGTKAMPKGLLRPPLPSVTK